MDEILFLQKTEQLDSVISLAERFGAFKGKVLSKKQWQVLFQNNPAQAEILLTRLFTEAFVTLSANFPSREELKGEKGDSIKGDQGRSIFGRRGKKGEPGKDAPQMDDIRDELQKMVDAVEVPQPVVQEPQVKEITKVVHQTIDFNVDREITRSGKAIRDALELIGPETEKLAQSAIRGLPARLKIIEARLDELFIELGVIKNSNSSAGGEWVGTTWEEATRIAQDVVTDLVGQLAKSFEHYRQNHNSYDVTDSTDTPTQITKTFNTPDGDIIYTLNFDVDGNPSTATLTGAGLPEDTGSLKTYDFSGGRTIPLLTYT